MSPFAVVDPELEAPPAPSPVHLRLVGILWVVGWGVMRAQESLRGWLLKLQEQAAALVQRLYGFQGFSITRFATGRERLIHLSKFGTEMTVADRGNPCRLWIKKISESELSVA